MSGRGWDMIIKPDGSVQVEAVGYKGRACIQATEELDQLLGSDVARTPKPEMYQEEQAEERLREGLGRPGIRGDES